MPWKPMISLRSLLSTMESRHAHTPSTSWASHMIPAAPVSTAVWKGG
eukprot:CAMPEP_0171239328 /NCGR_PEP_ID=MMETSP0790-20130122/43921_1 /TAXON_ID=2925 /ORGANISM="Alexandrium catenella, Strain OF101" /LENGTH=46 /DNA_ID= /DNA_START= /DNA_END= /DNA_ORIENTATION=